MAIIQITYYICDICGKTEIWCDIGVLPEGWKDIQQGTSRPDLYGDWKLYCPNCASKNASER